MLTLLFIQCKSTPPNSKLVYLDFCYWSFKTVSKKVNGEVDVSGV